MNTPTLMSIIESLGGAATEHLHEIFFRDGPVVQLWDPVSKIRRPDAALGSRLESARRRISTLVRRDVLNYYAYPRQGPKNAVFLSPYAYAVYQSELRGTYAPPSINGALRRWQRGALWTAFKALGISYRPCVGITENTVLATNSVDAISSEGRTALAVIDDPALDPADLIGQVPKAAPGKRYPVMLLFSDDGSCWDDAREIWAHRGHRFKALLDGLQSRTDCFLWTPPKMHGAAVLRHTSARRKKLEAAS